MLFHGKNISLPDEIVDNDPDFNSPALPRMLKNVNYFKDSLWKYWNDEY